MPFCLPLSNLGMQTISCDRTNIMQNTSLYCNTMPGASGYQFWFFDPHGSYTRRILRSGNFVRSNNIITNPLPTNLDLNVCARAMVSGNYLPFGAVCRARLVGGIGGTERDAQLLNDGTTVKLYPNPSQGDQVFLEMTGLSDEQQHIEIDLYDALGRNVHHGSFSNEGDAFNRSIDLNGQLAKGAYSVRIAVNGVLRSERLMIQ